MKANDKPKHNIQTVENWLTNQLGAPIRKLAPISGGFWSAAYGFEVSGKELVLRIGHAREGYKIDKLAMAFQEPMSFQSNRESTTALLSAFSITA